MNFRLQSSIGTGGAIGLFGALTMAPLCRAQVSAGADLTATYPTVWRGVVLTSKPALQPRVWLNAKGFSFGAWALAERYGTSERRLSVRGDRNTFPSAVDLWSEWHTRIHGQDFSGGTTWHWFRGSVRGITPANDGAEWYLDLHPRSGQPVQETIWYRLGYWRGFSPWHTNYAEAELGKQLLALPLFDATITPNVVVGYQFSRSPTVPLPTTPGARSVTHTQVGVRTSFAQRCDNSRWTYLPDASLAWEFARSAASRRKDRVHTRNGFLILELNLWPRYCANAK